MLKETIEKNAEVKVNSKEKEILQKQVDNERQPKKRFELNDELKKLKKELNGLEG